MRLVESHTLIVFRVSARRLGLPLAAVRSVVPVPLLEPPVGAPSFVEGYFDYRGQPIASLRLDRLLGLGEAPLGIYTPLLVLADPDAAIALHVARVDAILGVQPLRIQPIGEGETFNGCVVGRLTEREETVYLLSQQHLLLTVERDRLAAHRVMRERRLEALNGDAGHAR
jgi:chemotaxis signal transduction protein